MGKIKMLWDFRGPNSLKIAEHHEKHLKEYISVENLDGILTGFETLNEMHAVAYMVVEENQVKSLREALKPHRGELYIES